MMKTKKGFSLKTIHLVFGMFLIVSIGVFVGMGAYVQYRDLNETYRLAEETASYVKAECEKFDNYSRGNSASSLQGMLDTANLLKKYIAKKKLLNSEFLQKFIKTEHIGGIIVLDHSSKALAQADMDHKDSYTLWSETLAKSNLVDILQNPEETYIDNITIKETSYDVAATASEDGSFLIFCYSSTEKPSHDPYELTIKSILTNNSFLKNPTLIITDGTKILSTNNAKVEKKGSKQYQKMFSKIDWRENKLTEFHYSNKTYYGLRRVYNTYFVYIIYTADNIFANRTGVITFGFLVYLLIAVIILIVQRYFDKASMKKMEKQLHIINAISTAYDSTFLLDLDKMELEPIRPSERLKNIFEKTPKPYDFLFEICKNEIAKEYRSTVMHFLDLDTVSKRLKGKQFLGCEIQDCSGTWFSVLVVPQKCDDAGNVQALLVMTRDITSVKQTEELTFKDQLTGLYNRNYMEYKIKECVRSEDFPISLVMADCNYLKRTNDNLGHEYGDLLLQRIANVIMDIIPNDSVAMRVGGDEFLILCTQCTKQEAQQIVVEIKKRLVEKSDDMLTLSAAFGVSTTENGAFCFEQVYKEADQEMYNDKKASRISR